MSVTESIKSSAGIRNNDNIKYQVFPHVIDKFLSQIFFFIFVFLKNKKIKLPANDQIAFRDVSPYHSA